MRQVQFRSFAVVLAVALAVIVPGLVMGLHLGLDQAQFAAQGDTTLRAAGYAFSIWGPIYVGLIVYAVYQWRRRSDTLALFGWPSVISAACCAGWIVATALNWRWFAVGIILVGAVAAAIPLVQGARRPPLGRERWLVVWPNAVLAGWLMLASALAVLTVLTAQGDIAPKARTSWAVGGLVVVALATAGVAVRSRLAIVALPVVWGLIAVVVAERHEQLPVAASAGVAAGLLAGLALALALRGRAPTGETRPRSVQRGSQVGV